MGSLPQSLTVQNTYIELCSGSKVVTVVVRNNTAYCQMLKKMTPVAGAVMVTWIWELTVPCGSKDVLDKDHGHQVPKLTMKQWSEKLFKELYPSSLESWPPELVAAAWTLLAEYHDIFSLEPSKLGCSHSKLPMTYHSKNDSGRYLCHW